MASAKVVDRVQNGVRKRETELGRGAACVDFVLRSLVKLIIDSSRGHSRLL